MIVLCVVNCPAGLRGDLSKWLNEVNTGVYVGRLSARVREELWNRVCGNIKSGQATMVYSANNEQGYVFLTHNTTWVPVDYEGITLMRRPLALNEEEGVASFLKPGFSKAAKYEKMRSFKNNKDAEGYVVLGIVTTGSDPEKDRIIEIGLLRICGNEVERQYHSLIQSEEPEKLSAGDILTPAGISTDLMEREGQKEEVVLENIQEFIGNSLVICYNLQAVMGFLQKFAKRVGGRIEIKKARDVVQIARRNLDDLEDFNLETLASFFSLEVNNFHRALSDCTLIYEIYTKLNEF